MRKLKEKIRTKKDTNACLNLFLLFFNLFKFIILPPHMREGRELKTLKLSAFNITPACAGRTLYHVQKPIAARDHPRMCGKDKRRIFRFAPHSGSPPRVREGPPFRRSLSPFFRITPACAGRTDLTGSKQ